MTRSKTVVASVFVALVLGAYAERSDGHVGAPGQERADAIKPVEPRGLPEAPTTDTAATVEDDREAFRYLAIISGNCHRFVLADRTLPTCANRLANVDFGNGRVAFMFTATNDGQTIVTTFSGGRSQQEDARAYRLAVDHVSTTIQRDGASETVVAATDGLCTMRGDPMHERARFECGARHRGVHTVASFESVGVPVVYAGTRASGSDSIGTLGAYR